MITYINSILFEKVLVKIQNLQYLLFLIANMFTYIAGIQAYKSVLKSYLFHGNLVKNMKINFRQNKI